MLSTKIEEIINFLVTILEVFGPFFGFFVIILESILPVLPLAAFITLNMLVFGSFYGFLISWMGTVIGCLIAFMICRRGFSSPFYRFIKNEGKIDKFMQSLSQIKLSHLVILLALPFTPAFLINYAAGLSKIDFKHFFLGLLIGKLSIVYFWGFIGTTLVESISNPLILIQLFILLAIIYSLSIVVQRKIH
ncbi:MAG: TVP38/TMEM64 family protein [Bacilli bacterium]|jgi:uncharacterized membrane protein YdjX (TVP38/TMEM64 family)